MTRAIVRVRPAQADDVEAVVALVRAADLRTGTRAVPDDELAARVRTLFADDGRVFLVAVDDDDAVAGLLAARHEPAGAVDLTPVLHISHLVVRPDERRRGAGRALLTAAVQIAEQAGAEHVLATVAAASREGNRYLARIGFAPLVLQRIAPVGVLRRSLGMNDAGSRMAVLRRARMARAQRAGFGSRAAARPS
ncbi:GNAT family N-acetyltransferase [Jatrophihabitans endophyticus]|uniref:GNAT family N-acetyltransferase n=1 Tax=Jatrophihabitans endophyticus TaxID=1206085 RepID=UPI0019E3D01F|nr:GNAT family N-acetyltransferase [Jatrophihabitans endophyticus]MBE7188212.1 GNAT family N-acetyltransferase [Jatrophihabitans endophyticus]